MRSSDLHMDRSRSRPSVELGGRTPAGQGGYRWLHAPGHQTSPRAYVCPLQTSPNPAQSLQSPRRKWLKVTEWETPRPLYHSLAGWCMPNTLHSCLVNCYFLWLGLQRATTDRERACFKTSGSCVHFIALYYQHLSFSNLPSVVLFQTPHDNAKAMQTMFQLLYPNLFAFFLQGYRIC